MWLGRVKANFRVSSRDCSGIVNDHVIRTRLRFVWSKLQWLLGWRAFFRVKMLHARVIEYWFELDFEAYKMRHWFSGRCIVFWWTWGFSEKAWICVHGCRSEYIECHLLRFRRSLAPSDECWIGRFQQNISDVLEVIGVIRRCTDGKISDCLVNRGMAHANCAKGDTFA